MITHSLVLVIGLGLKKYRFSEVNVDFISCYVTRNQPISLEYHSNNINQLAMGKEGEQLIFNFHLLYVELTDCTFSLHIIMLLQYSMIFVIHLRVVEGKLLMFTKYKDLPETLRIRTSLNWCYHVVCIDTSLCSLNETQPQLCQPITVHCTGQ